VSVLVRESELFLGNLSNLKVVEREGKVEYAFREPEKDPRLARDRGL
jgi:hypothetical protein